MKKVLTKSNYALGLQCFRQLWIKYNQPEKASKPSIADMFRFSEGHKVGALAQTLFPDGIVLSSKNYSKNIEDTQKSLKQGKPLFEAGFQFEQCSSRADILKPTRNEVSVDSKNSKNFLEPVGKEWDLIEVKSSTKVKDINVHDVSFQKYVCESSGLKIRKCFLMYVNNEYVRQGELDTKKLFVQEDITSEVNAAMDGIKDRIDTMFKVIASAKPPKAGILTGTIITQDYHKCLNENCIENLPENNVFCLYRGGKLSLKLYQSGIIKIKDIPEQTKLTEIQKIQRECELNNEIHIEKEKINHFLSSLKYPVYYLDFETFATAIPMFDGLKPYSPVPFQFSLHVVKKEGGKPEHHAFLYEGNADPREEFTAALKEVIGDKGSVLVFNMGFEKGRLKSLAEHFPKHKNWIDNVIKRLVDLLIPFREFSYYNAKQEGSASIKAVLPAITGKSYSDLEISGGEAASSEFYRITYEDCSEKEKKEIRNSLLKYCELDTLAEVMIVEKLRDIV